MTFHNLLTFTVQVIGWETLDSSSVKMLVQKSTVPAGLRKRPWQPPPAQHDLWTEIETLDPPGGDPVAHNGQQQPGNGGSGGGSGGGGGYISRAARLSTIVKARPDAPEAAPFRRVRASLHLTVV